MGPHTKGWALLLAIGLYVNILMHLIKEKKCVKPSFIVLMLFILYKLNRLEHDNTNIMANWYNFLLVETHVNYT